MKALLGSVTFFCGLVVGLYGQDHVFGFGDSYMCTGNLKAATGSEKLHDGVFWKGVASDGPLWVMHFVKELGLSSNITASVHGGNNFAFGGAITGYGLRDGVSKAVGLQIKSALGRYDGKFPHNSLAIIFVGGNYFRTQEFIFDMFRSRSLMEQHLESHVLELYEGGIRNFYISNLPPFGSVPAVRGLRKSLQLDFGFRELNEAADESLEDFFPVLSSLFNDELDKRYNKEIMKMLSTLEKEMDISICQLDSFGFLSDVLSFPEAYGLSNVEIPRYDYINKRWLREDDDGAFFFDLVHLSATVHKLLAEESKAQWKECESKMVWQ